MKIKKVQKINQRWWIFLLLFTLSLSLHAQSTLENLNQNLRYSRYSRLAVKIIPLKQSNTNFLLQMPVEKIEDNIEFDDYLFSYAIVGSFTEEITDNKIIRLTEDKLVRENERHFYFEESVTVPIDQPEAYVVFWAKDTRQGDEYIFHIDLKGQYIFEKPSFGAYFGNNIPFDQTFLNVEDALLFRGNTGVNLHSFFYPQQFNVPLPPMETKPAAVPREIEVERCLLRK